MRVASSTSPTRASVPGSISPARFSPNLAARPLRCFPFRPTRPLDPLADRIIPYCLRRACTHSEFALVPGKKHCGAFLTKKPRSQPRKSHSALAQPDSSLRWPKLRVIDLKLDPDGTHQNEQSLRVGTDQVLDSRDCRRGAHFDFFHSLFRA